MFSVCLSPQQFLSFLKAGSISFSSRILHAHLTSGTELQEMSLGKCSSTHKWCVRMRMALQEALNVGSPCVSPGEWQPQGVYWNPLGLKDTAKNTWEVGGPVVSEIFYLACRNLVPLLQQSPTFLAPRTVLVGDNFSMD